MKIICFRNNLKDNNCIFYKILPNSKQNIEALLLFSILIFSSCQYFEKQVPSEKELLKKELKAINWKEVDEYPSFADCDKLDNKTKRQQCFFEYLTELIQQN
jgi:uncharacterized FlgJ-related protein